MQLLSLTVTSDRFRKGLSPSITQPCPTHHRLTRVPLGQACAALVLGRAARTAERVCTVLARLSLESAAAACLAYRRTG